MFMNAKSLAVTAIATAAGMFSIAPRADAQVYIERVYDPTCDYSRRADYAGTLTVDCVSYRISTRCSILDQIEEAFLCRGYDVCRVGRSVRVYKDCGGPDICFDSGMYDLRVRSFRSFYSISVVRCSWYEDDCDSGYRRGGYRYRHDDGVRFGIHLEFGDHDHELDFDHRDDRREHDGRGRDDWRDGGDGRGDRGNDRGDRGNFGERSGGRTYVTPERRLDRPDDTTRTPRVIEPTPGTESTKPSIGTGNTGGKVDDQPARRGNKLGGPRSDDDGQPDLGLVKPTPRVDQRDRIVVREPDVVKRDGFNRSGTVIGNGSRSSERAQPRSQPVESPAPVKQPAKQPSTEPRKEVTKEPSRVPSNDKKNDQGNKDQGGKKDRRW